MPCVGAVFTADNNKCINFSRKFPRGVLTLACSRTDSFFYFVLSRPFFLNSGKQFFKFCQLKSSLNRNSIFICNGYTGNIFIIFYYYSIFSLTCLMFFSHFDNFFTNCSTEMLFLSSFKLIRIDWLSKSNMNSCWFYLKTSVIL